MPWLTMFHESRRVCRRHAICGVAIVVCAPCPEAAQIRPDGHQTEDEGSQAEIQEELVALTTPWSPTRQDAVGLDRRMRVARGEEHVRVGLQACSRSGGVNLRISVDIGHASRLPYDPSSDLAWPADSARMRHPIGTNPLHMSAWPSSVTTPESLMRPAPTTITPATAENATQTGMRLA